MQRARGRQAVARERAWHAVDVAPKAKCIYGVSWFADGFWDREWRAYLAGHHFVRKNKPFLTEDYYKAVMAAEDTLGKATLESKRGEKRQWGSFLAGVVTGIAGWAVLLTVLGLLGK